MKVKAIVDIYMGEDYKISKGMELNVEYVDDKKSLVWLNQEEKEMPAGDFFVSILTFSTFFKAIQ